MTHDITVKVIRTWALQVDAESRDDAEDKADLMEVVDIESRGTLKRVQKEYAEINNNF